MEERKPKRKRGPSAFGNFDQTKAIAEEAIKERREADARKTQRLRELRLAGKATPEGSKQIPAQPPAK
ncbi:hypothetical protein [Pararhizobium sp. PWRC1-1]|uniref:hypothetical protein n=1 Tax=Pararhizobium sp. PWRC1-1 TaxID=2804566 RepID=UPI003CF98B05